MRQQEPDLGLWLWAYNPAGPEQDSGEGHRLGRALREVGQVDRADSALREAYEIFSRLGLPEADDLSAALA